MTAKIPKAKSLLKQRNVWAAEPSLSAYDRYSCIFCGAPLTLKRKSSPGTRPAAWFSHLQKSECRYADCTDDVYKAKSLYETPIYIHNKTMSQLFTQAVFESPVEKKNFSIKQSTAAHLGQYVTYVNALNKMLVDLENLNHPAQAPLKAATLDESAIVERILDRMLAQDPDFQTYLRTGEVQLSAAPKRGRTKRD